MKSRKRGGGTAPREGIYAGEKLRKRGGETAPREDQNRPPAWDRTPVPAAFCPAAGRNRALQSDCRRGIIEVYFWKTGEIGMAGKVQKAHHEAGGGSFVLGSILAGLDLQDVVSQIKKGTQYVVEIPQEYRKGLSSGRYTFLQNKNTGKTWATICEKLPNGQTKIVSNCPIKAEVFCRPGQLRDLLDSMSNLAIQCQLGSLFKRLDEVKDIVLRIEKGQKADRIGKLSSGINQIMIALKMKDVEQRKHEISVGRGRILEARDQIGMILGDLVEEFKPIDKRLIKQLWDAVWRSGWKNYFDQKDDKYNEMVECCELYIFATNCIAESYMLCDEEESAEDTFDRCKEFFRNLDFRNVRTIRCIHPKLQQGVFFFDDIENVISADRDQCLRPKVEIEIDGETLLALVDQGRGKNAYAILANQLPCSINRRVDRFVRLNKEDHVGRNWLTRGGQLVVPVIIGLIGKSKEQGPSDKSYDKNNRL